MQYNNIIIACIERKASIYLTHIITVKFHAGNNNILCNTAIIDYTGVITCPFFSKHTKISRNLIQIRHKASIVMITLQIIKCNTWIVNYYIIYFFLCSD